MLLRVYSNESYCSYQGYVVMRVIVVFIAIMVTMVHCSCLVTAILVIITLQYHHHHHSRKHPPHHQQQHHETLGPWKKEQGL